MTSILINEDKSTLLFQIKTKNAKFFCGKYEKVTLGNISLHEDISMCFISLHSVSLIELQSLLRKLIKIGRKKWGQEWGKDWVRPDSKTSA